MFIRSPYVGIVTGAIWLCAAGCSTVSSPSAPSAVAADTSSFIQTSDMTSHGAQKHTDEHDKGYVDGWFDGEDVQLYYTKSYFCAPLTSVAAAPCELGAPAEAAPRRGPIPTIYAIAAAPSIANLVDPATLACGAGTPCLNHPLMIDLSRIGGSPTAGPAAHNHILTARGAGWFHTMNVRVFSLAAWNEIAAAKTLSKVRDLQGDPNVGRPGVISADTPTNIYFFIASSR